MKVILLFLLLIIASFSFGKCRAYYNVKYETENGWSKIYNVQVTFETGVELNGATQTNDYEPYSVYATIFWGPGEATIIKIIYFPFNCYGELPCFYLEHSPVHNYDGRDKKGVLWYIEN